MPALTGILGAGLAWLGRRRLPQTQGAVQVSGLRDQVEIIHDHWGVPHIYALSFDDLMFAQGFAHAQDRLFQMDIVRRLAEGRLSEIMGSRTLRYDRWLRIFGLRRAAEQEVGLLSPKARRALEAYAAGVSALMARGPLPIECAILRYRPEPWSVADSLSSHKMMAWMLSGNWQEEVLRASLIERLGPELEAELEPPWLDRWPCIIPSQAERGPVPGAGVSARRSIGSNSWAIAGSRTAGGAPILASDMHLMLQVPSYWYENHLVLRGAGPHDDELNVTGVTSPGLLGVIAGHNGHVAWSFTDSFADVQDLYREHLRRSDDGRVYYEYRGRWHEAEVRREVIHVRLCSPVVEEVIVTRHGPIVNALAPRLAGDDALALRWTSLEPDPTFEAYLGLMRARDCGEAHDALRDWVEPVLNAVYADTAGNIAYTLAGKVPIRERGRGELPVPGWTGEYEWTRYIPFGEMPSLHNPPQGYIATANNRITADGYPYHIGSDFAQGDRAQRIIELLEARDPIDLPYVRRMQYDQVSPTARVVAGYLGRLRVNDATLRPIVEMMRRWDGRLGPESPEAAVFEVFMRRTIYLLLDGLLGDLTVHYAGKGTTPLLFDVTLFGLWAWQWIEVTLADPHSHWFDLGHGETRDDVLCRVLGETVAWLRDNLGPFPRDWAWSRMHQLVFTHVFDQIKPIAPFFNRGPYPLGGDETTVWAAGTAPWDLSSRRVMGPPNRFIVDLGDVRRSVSMVAPGQSGNPASRHYDDQVGPWFDGTYHSLLYRRIDVEREAEARLFLIPPCA